MTKQALLLLAGLLPAAAWPASLAVTVADSTGAPLEDAIVWALPKSAPVPKPMRTAAVQQIDKTFVPLVTAVQAGASVSFPNRDEIRHHVYSFSPAKVFEIKLYAGAPTPPSIVFDKAGEVVLGCNIHDTMLGYIYVVDTPYYGKAGKEGRVRLENLPDGDYEVHVWHYAQAAMADGRLVHARADEAAPLAFTLATKPRVARPAPR